MHTACIPAPHSHSHHYQCRTPYAAVHTIVLLIMCIMMTETCWDNLIINIRLVASCWFLSLHPRLLRFNLGRIYCFVVCACELLKSQLIMLVWQDTVKIQLLSQYTEFARESFKSCCSDKTFLLRMAALNILIIFRP